MIDPNNVQNNAIKDIYRDLNNGNWKVRMIVKRSIPSTLSVGRFRLEIFYRGQQQTCWKCGIPGCRKQNCTTSSQWAGGGFFPQ